MVSEINERITRIDERKELIVDGLTDKPVNVELTVRDYSYLLQQAGKVGELERETQWLYGRLNMISHIIEEGRKEVPR